MVNPAIREEDRVYLKTLESQRSTMQVDQQPTLLEEWRELRAWILRSLPGFEQKRPSITPPDFATQLRQKFVWHDGVHEKAFKTVVIDLWHAHTNGDIEAFGENKVKLVRLWRRYSDDRKQIVSEGFSRWQRSRSV